MILWLPPSTRVVTTAPALDCSEDVLRQMERAGYRAGWRRWWTQRQDILRRIRERMAFIDAVASSRERTNTPDREAAADRDRPRERPKRRGSPGSPRRSNVGARLKK